MSRAVVLDRLFDVIDDRRRERPAGSYVVQLLDGAPASLAAKVREEAEELIEAAAGADRAHTVHEAADLLFHVLVLLADAGVRPDDVYGALESRFGVGGLEEKAARERGDG